jgi:class 3 adenylate cyclase
MLARPRLGDNLAGRGNPAFKRATVGNCGPGTVLGGYTLVTASSLEAAAALPPGSTRVVVLLDDEDGGTRLTLRHDDLATRELHNAHQAAWETYLHRLAIRAAGGDPGPEPRNHLAHSRGIGEESLVVDGYFGA